MRNLIFRWVVSKTLNALLPFAAIFSIDPITLAANLNAFDTAMDTLRAIINGSPYKKAAALIDLLEALIFCFQANDERGIPEEITDLQNNRTVANFYILFVSFDVIWTPNYFALIILNFFEKPLWCSSVSKVSCSNRHYYYLGELPYLTSAGSLAFE
ncbi:hypothetical protein Tco_1436160, partial [Tanacetum coccineum]